LQAAFRDPASPFYLAPGTVGPASPDEIPLEFSSLRPLTTSNPNEHDTKPYKSLYPDHLASAEEAKATLTSMGYDAASLFEQKIVWGDHDSFQRVSLSLPGRIVWLHALGHRLGGAQKAQNMTTGKGVSVILKSINVNFKRPVVFPDTLLIGHRIFAPGQSGVVSTKASRMQFDLEAVAYSYKQQRIVTESVSTLVWYDYDTLKKCDPGEKAWAVLHQQEPLK
ncbi:hypothetical protein CONPUDRAFT_66404, partial [Coniophora puteana RWD-64-598 SS2]